MNDAPPHPPYAPLSDAPPVVEVVAAVLVREGRVLVAKRPAAKRNGGLWEFPGGKVEPGETHAEALTREIEEELGLFVEVGSHLMSVEHTYPFGRIRLHAYFCHPKGAAPHESHTKGDAPVAKPQPRALEHAAIEFVNPEDWGTRTFAPANVPIADALAAALKGTVSQHPLPRTTET